MLLREIIDLFQGKKLLYWVTGFILAVFLIVFGFLSWSGGKMIHGLSVAGVEVGGMDVKQASAILTVKLNHLLKKKIILTYKDRAFTVVPGAVGIKPDLAATIRKAYQTGRVGPVWDRIIIRIKAYRGGIDSQLIFNHNHDTLASFYRLLDAIIAVEPVRSVITVNPGGEVNYSPSRAGRALDQQALTRLLERAATDARVSHINIPVKTIIPPLTREDIEKWGMGQIMGIYSTKFDPSKTGRVQNLILACAAIDNTIVYPGQTFSFNTWVGPRVSEAGYQEAPVVLSGKLVPGIGGGVCQVSSTLYNAVLLANLKIVQRFNHTLPSPYVPLGRDATVVYGGIDFIFENNYQNPILLSARVAPPYVTIAVLGEKAGWEEVSLETVLIETYPFQVKEIPDPTLRKGQRIKIHDGQPGSKVELWRKVLLSDDQIKKELVNTSIYPSQPEEYKVGGK
ncbi:MAG: VanW family protein [Firmicutes bacterium]|nr:VanW family protein [Bacillota bacterium]